MATAGTCIPRSVFLRCVKDVIAEHSSTGQKMHVSADALTKLQTTAENHLEKLFESANIIATHVNRTTLQPKDMQYINQLHNIKHPPSGTILSYDSDTDILDELHLSHQEDEEDEGEGEEYDVMEEEDSD